MNEVMIGEFVEGITIWIYHPHTNQYLKWKESPTPIKRKELVGKQKGNIIGEMEQSWMNIGW